METRRVEKIWNAIRKDEKIDEIHSIYVDQWDWEMIAPESNPQNFVVNMVKSIHELIYTLERENIEHKQLPFTYNNVIPKEIFFISSEDLGWVVNMELFLATALVLLILFIEEKLSFIYTIITNITNITNIIHIL